MSSSAPLPNRPDPGRPSIGAGADPESEDDPTGIRALLAALPDPGPMPASLVDRISASLAAEQRTRSSADPTRPAARQSLLDDRFPHASRTGSRFSSRRHGARLRPARFGQVTRRPARDPRPPGRPPTWHRALLAAAGTAAALAVVGALGSNLLHGAQAGSASAGGAAQLSSESSPAAAAGGAATPATRGQAASKARPPVVALRLSNTDYSAADLALGARRLLTSGGPTMTPMASEAPAIGPIGTAAGVAACLAALGVPTADSAVVDIARYDGQPAAVVVTSTPDGMHTAYVVRRSCTTGRPSLLHPAQALR